MKYSRYLRTRFQGRFSFIAVQKAFDVDAITCGVKSYQKSCVVQPDKCFVSVHLV